MNYDKKHVIYLLASPSNKLYIGRTCNYFSRMRRHENMSDNCRKLNRAIEKYGWDNFDIIILEDNLTYTKATARETFFIHLFDSVSSGYNILHGGIGLGSGKDCVNSGIKHTKEHRMKNSEAKTGDRNPNFGIPRTLETRIKISESQPNKRKIRSFNIKTKEMKIFESVSDAAKELNVHSGKISGILNKTVEINRHGNLIVRRQVGGYTFEDFDENAEDMTYEEISKTTTEKTREKLRIASKGRNAKGVIGYHVLGYTIEFDVIKDAAKELNIDDGEISKCAKGLCGPRGGFTWKYANEEERTKYPVWDINRKSGAQGRPIYRILEDGTKDEYNSAADAKHIFGGDIYKSLRTGCTAGGYRWFYI